MNAKLERRTSLPGVLFAYTLFSIFATVFAVATIFSEPLRSAAVPYTGWIGVLPYSMTIFFAVIGCYFLCPQANSAVVSSLKCLIIIGLVDTLYFFCSYLLGIPNFQNPYLTFSPLRPIITIMLPFVWCVAINYENGRLQRVDLDCPNKATNNPMDRSGGSAAS